VKGPPDRSTMNSTVQLVKTVVLVNVVTGISATVIPLITFTPLLTPTMRLAESMSRPHLTLLEVADPTEKYARSPSSTGIGLLIPITAPVEGVVAVHVWPDKVTAILNRPVVGIDCGDFAGG